MSQAQKWLLSQKGCINGVCFFCVIVGVILKKKKKKEKPFPIKTLIIKLIITN